MTAPPSVGPTMLARPKTLITSPIQRPRSRGLKMSPIVAVESAIIAPPPIPATTRARISHTIPGAAPPSSEPTMKNAIPTSSSGRRP